MPAIVPGYEHNIFVSYSHLDNEFSEGFGEPWVSKLVERLEVPLIQTLGERKGSLFWMDKRNLVGNEPVTPAIIKAVENSALLLIVLSPGYLKSEWCRRERNKFLQTVAKFERRTSRIFKVERDEVMPEELPEELNDLIPYRFWIKHPNKMNPRIFASPMISDIDKKEYSELINDLSRDMARELRLLIQLKDKNISQSEVRNLEQSPCHESEITKSDIIEACTESFTKKCHQNKSTSELIGQQIENAALQIRLENFEAAKKTIARSRLIDSELLNEHQNMVNLLEWYANLLSTAPESKCKINILNPTIMAIGFDWKMIAVAGTGGLVSLVDTITWQVSKDIQLNYDQIDKLLFTAKDNSKIIANAGSEIALCDSNDSAIIESHNLYDLIGHPAVLTISCSGHYVATSSNDCSINVINLKNKNVLTAYASDIVTAIAFSDDEKLVASGSRDGTTTIWELYRGRTEIEEPDCIVFIGKDHQYKHEITQLAFDQGGTLLAAGDERGNIWTWEWGWKDVIPFSGHKSRVKNILFLNDDKLVASSSDDHTIRLWDTDSGICLSILQWYNSAINSIVSDSSYLYCLGADGVICKWRLPISSVKILDLDYHATSVAISPVGSSICVGLSNGSIIAYGLPDMVEMWPKPIAHTREITKLAFSPDGSILASYCMDGVVNMWNSGNGALYRHCLLQKNREDVIPGSRPMAFRPDGRFVVAVNHDKDICICDLCQGPEGALKTVRSPRGNIVSLNFDRTGELLLSASEEGVGYLWRFEDGNISLIHTWEHDGGAISTATISPDGTLAAIAGANRAIKIIDIKKREVDLTLDGGQGDTCFITFSPDCKQLIAANSDGTVRFYYLPLGEEIFTLKIPVLTRDLDLPFLEVGFCNIAPPRLFGGCWMAVPVMHGGMRGGVNRRESGGKLIVYRMGSIYKL